MSKNVCSVGASGTMNFRVTCHLCSFMICTLEIQGTSPDGIHHVTNAFTPGV